MKLVVDKLIKKANEEVKKIKSIDDIDKINVECKEQEDALTLAFMFGKYLAKKQIENKEFDDSDEFIDYFETPKEQIKYMQLKDPVLFADLPDEKEYYFWIKKAQSLEVTKKVQDALIKNIEEGKSFYYFVEQLKEDGIYDKKDRSYWEGAYNQNISMAQSSANLQEMRKTKDKGFSYARFSAILDGRETQTCHNLHGKVMKIDDWIKNNLIPPIHYGCRSMLIQLSDKEVEDKDGNIRKYIKQVTEEDLKHKHKGFGSVSTVNDLKKYVKQKQKKIVAKQKQIQKVVTPPAPTPTPPQNTTYTADVIDLKTNKKHSEIAGATKGKPMTHKKADNWSVNPYYGIKPGHDTNCQAAVATYEARLRGYDVEVLPKTPGSMLEKLSYQTNLVWVDRKTKTHPDYIEITRPDGNVKEVYIALKQQLKKGARYTIEYDYKDGMGGHIQNLWLDEKTNELVIYDPQANLKFEGLKEIIKNILREIKLKTYLDKQTKKRITPTIDILRIDNLDFNKEVADRIMKKKGK